MYIALERLDMCAHSPGLWQAELAEKDKVIASLRHKLENDSAEGTAVGHLPFVAMLLCSSSNILTA